MPKKLALAILFSLTVLACSLPAQVADLISADRSALQTSSVYTQARVTHVVDGDTIYVEIGGDEFKVRYIGINAPEMDHPERGQEPFARQATARNRELVAGQVVGLEKDTRDTDRYGRLLRYVWLDGVMVNETLVREGLARSNAYPPDVKHQPELDQAEREARASHRGLWQ